MTVPSTTDILIMDVAAPENPVSIEFQSLGDDDGYVLHLKIGKWDEGQTTIKLFTDHPMMLGVMLASASHKLFEAAFKEVRRQRHTLNVHRDKKRHDD